ncbi:Trigger factor [subsurface metagenome]
MKVTNEKVENRQAFLSIEMEPAEVEESLEESYHRLVQITNIPGFRKGKAPRAILERYVNRESLLKEALGALLPKACEKAIKEQKLEAIAQPHIEVTQTDPVVFKATVPLRPTVELGDYHNIRVTPEPAEVKEDDVGAIIERLRHRHATWEPVERPVGFNDLVVLDVESSIEDKPFSNQKGAQYLAVQNQPFPVLGFTEQLVGLKRDEGKEFQLQFPTDFPKGELAGKKASFKVRVIEIKQEKLPKLNSEFAKGINPDCKTLNSLRKHILANLKLKAEEKARIDFEEQVMDAAADTSQVEFPPILVEREIDRLLNQRLRRWQATGNSLEEYLSSINKTEEEVREELRPLATKRTTWALVLGEIAEEEKIKVSNSAINTEIKNIIKGVAEDKRDEINKFLNTPESHKSIEQTLLTRKTIEWLVEIAKGSNMSIETPQKKEEQK